MRIAFAVSLSHVRVICSRTMAWCGETVAADGRRELKRVHWYSQRRDISRTENFAHAGRRAKDAGSPSQR